MPVVGKLSAFLPPEPLHSVWSAHTGIYDAVGNQVANPVGHLGPNPAVSFMEKSAADFGFFDVTTRSLGIECSRAQDMCWHLQTEVTLGCLQQTHVGRERRSSQVLEVCDKEPWALDMHSMQSSKR